MTRLHKAHFILSNIIVMRFHPQEAINLLEPMTNDPVNYVRQGALIASALIMIQQSEVTCPKVRLWNCVEDKWKAFARNEMHQNWHRKKAMARIKTEKWLGCNTKEPWRKGIIPLKHFLLKIIKDNHLHSNIPTQCDVQDCARDTFFNSGILGGIASLNVYFCVPGFVFSSPSSDL